MLDLLRSLEWAGSREVDLCPSCRYIRDADAPNRGHSPTCRIARAIRELAEESPGEPLDIPATAAFIRDHVAIADRVLGPVVDGPAICPPPRTTRPILPPEPTVDEMAREMGLVLVTDGVRAHWADRETGAARIYWSAEKARATHFEDTREWLNESDAIRTLYREHKAKQIDATIAGKRVGPWLTPPAPRVYEASGPPTDPSTLAAWLYARVVPGRTIAESTGRRFVVLAVDMSADGQRVFVDEANGYAIPRLRQAPITRLLNPDGTVLWEAT